MAVVIKITVTDNSGRSSTDLSDRIKREASLKMHEIVGLQNYLAAVSTGQQVATLDTQVYATTATNKGTGTVTCASVSVADTVTIAAVVFTAVASGAVGNQFNQGGTDTATAASLVVAINANATTSKYVVATSALGVVTLTATATGALGNLVTTVSSNGTRLAVSAATLTGGTNDTANTYSYGA